MRLVHGATTASPIALTVGTDFIGGVAPGTASAYVLTEASGSTATKVEITDGGTILCTGLTTLSATPTVYSVFALGVLPATPGRALRHSHRPLTESSGAQSPGFHSPLEEAAALPTIAPPRSNLPADPVPGD